MKVNDIIKKVENGQVLYNLEVTTDYIKELNRVFSSITPISAILIASARREIFEPNDDGARSWIRWAQDNFTFNDSYIHQLRKVGNMLLDTMKEDQDLYHKLLTVGFDKLYSLSRLNLDPFNKFVQENDIHSLSRDEVRDAVNQELGGASNNTPTKKSNPMIPSEQMWQPGFCDIVNEVAAWDEDFTEAAAQDESIDPWISARGGLSLLDISIRRLRGGGKLQKEFKEALIETLEKDIEELRSIDQED